MMRTLETWIHASFSLFPPVLPPRWVGGIFSCRLTRLAPSTSTRSRFGSALRTRPVTPLLLPDMTRTRSPLWIFMSLEHLRGDADDLHEALVAQLPADRTEDAGAARVLLLVDEHGGVLVEADVG